MQKIREFLQTIDKDKFLYNLFGIAFGIEATLIYIKLPLVKNIRNIPLTVLLVSILILERKRIREVFFQREIVKWTLIFFSFFVAFFYINLHSTIQSVKPVFGLSIIYMSYFCLKKKEDVFNIWKFPILFVSVSSFVAIMQFLHMDFFWGVRGLIKNFHHPVLVNEFFLRSRPFGINYYGIHLSYSVALFLPICFYYLYRSRSLFWGALTFINSFYAIVSGVRSLLLSLVAVFVGFVIYWFYKRNYVSKFGLSVGALGLFFIATVYALLGMNDFSALSRFPLMSNALVTLFHSPLGLLEPFDINDAATFLFPYLPNTDAVAAVFKKAPHNYLLTFAVANGGLIGLALGCWTIWQCISLNFKSIGFEKTFRYGLLLGLISYHLGAMFHNAGGLMGHQLFFYYVAGLIALKRTSEVEAEERRSSPNLSSEKLGPHLAG